MTFNKFMLIAFAWVFYSAAPTKRLFADWPESIQAGHTGYETGLVQSLINEANAIDSLAVDGIFGAETEKALRAFQTARGMPADGIVGPNTWKKLFQNRERYLIRFSVGPSVPDSDATAENDALYECKVSRSLIDEKGIGAPKEYRGSIMPDDLGVKGRINDGFYVLHLGLHKRQGLSPTTADLIVKTNGTLRPCLVVNQDGNVPVTSNDANKTSSYAIHLHNGFYTQRGSEGCQTISPSAWSDFITHFLDKYQSLDDWSKQANSTHTYRGNEIGFLLVE